MSRWRVSLDHLCSFNSCTLKLTLLATNGSSGLEHLLIDVLRLGGCDTTRLLVMGIWWGDLKIWTWLLSRWRLHADLMINKSKVRGAKLRSKGDDCTRMEVEVINQFDTRGLLVCTVGAHFQFQMISLTIFAISLWCGWYASLIARR